MAVNYAQQQKKQQQPGVQTQPQQPQQTQTAQQKPASMQSPQVKQQQQPASMQSNAVKQQRQPASAAAMTKNKIKNTGYPSNAKEVGTRNFASSNPPQDNSFGSSDSFGASSERTAADMAMQADMARQQADINRMRLDNEFDGADPSTHSPTPLSSQGKRSLNAAPQVTQTPNGQRVNGVFYDKDFTATPTEDTLAYSPNVVREDALSRYSQAVDASKYNDYGQYSNKYDVDTGAMENEYQKLSNIHDDGYEIQGNGNVSAIQQAAEAAAQSKLEESGDTAALRGFADTNQAKLAEAEQNKPGEYQSTYEQQLGQTMDNILNRKEFNYDAETDPAYQAYAKQYRQAAQASRDSALAAARANNGGFGSTSAQMAANAAYAEQMNNMSNKIPELMNTAYGRYQDDIANRRGDVSMLQTADDSGYNKYRDTVGDFKDDRNFYAGQVQNAYQTLLNSKNQDLSSSKFGADVAQNAVNNQVAIGNVMNDTEGLKLEAHNSEIGNNITAGTAAAQAARDVASTQIDVNEQNYGQFDSNRDFDYTKDQDYLKHVADQLNVSMDVAKQIVSENQEQQRLEEAARHNKSTEQLETEKLAQDQSQFESNLDLQNRELEQNQSQFETEMGYKDKALAQDQSQFESNLDLQNRELEQNQSQFETEMGYKDKALAQDQSQFESNLDLQNRELNQDQSQFESNLDLQNRELAQKQSQFESNLDLQNRELAQNQSQFDTTQAFREQEAAREQGNIDWQHGYQEQRDTINDQRYEDETAYSHGRDTVADQQWQQQFDQGVTEFAEGQQLQRDLASLDNSLEQKKLDQSQAQWQSEFDRQVGRDKKADAQTSWDHALDTAQRTASQNETTYAHGMDKMSMGVMPSSAELAAMGMSQQDAQNYINRLMGNISSGGGSGYGSSGGGGGYSGGGSYGGSSGYYDDSSSGGGYTDYSGQIADAEQAAGNAFAGMAGGFTADVLDFVKTATGRSGKSSGYTPTAKERMQAKKAGDRIK